MSRDTNPQQALVGSGAVDVTIAALDTAPAAIAVAVAKVMTEKEKTKRAKIKAKDSRRK